MKRLLTARRSALGAQACAGRPARGFLADPSPLGQNVLTAATKTAADPPERKISPRGAEMGRGMERGMAAQGCSSGVKLGVESGDEARDGGAGWIAMEEMRLCRRQTLRLERRIQRPAIAGPMTDAPVLTPAVGGGRSGLPSRSPTFIRGVVPFERTSGGLGGGGPQARPKRGKRGFGKCLF